MLYAHEGAIRHLAQQTEQAWCLTLLTNFHGTIEVEVDTEFAKLDRPLRLRRPATA